MICYSSKAVYFGLIQVRRLKNVVLSAYSLKPNFDNLTSFHDSDNNTFKNCFHHKIVYKCTMTTVPLASL